MKKQILVFSALIIMAAFFTACEQDAIINPADDITQFDIESEATKLSPEEVEEFMKLLEDETTEEGIESRCNFPVSLHVMGPYYPELSLSWCVAKYRFIVATNDPQDYHITIEQKRDGTYPIFDVFQFLDKTCINWLSPSYFKDSFHSNNECEITVRIYVRNRRGCGNFRKVLDVPLQL